MYTAVTLWQPTTLGLACKPLFNWPMKEKHGPVPAAAAQIGPWWDRHGQLPIGALQRHPGGGQVLVISARL